MKKKIFKILLSSTLFSAFSSSFIAMNIKQYSNINKSSQKVTQTKRFSSSYSKLQYQYDNKIFDTTQLNKLKTFSNKDVMVNSNVSTNSKAESPISIETQENGQIHLKRNKYSSVVNSVENLPLWAVSLEYENIDPSHDGYAQSGHMNKDNLTRWDSFYVFDKGIPSNLFDKPLSGVVLLNQVHWNSEIKSWSQFSFVKGEDAYSASDLSSSFPSINDKSLPIYSKYDYTDASRGWKREQIALAILDNKFWFTNVGSSITIQSKNLNTLSLEEFKRKSIDEMLQYFDIILNNTPKYCVSNGESDNASNISISFNDVEQTISLTVTTPRRYSPKFTTENGTTNKQWIENSSMTQTISVPYSDFSNGTTTINLNISTIGIVANGEIRNLSPYEISSQLGTNNPTDNKTILQKFIYDNRKLIFDNLPELWDSSEFYDNINLNQGNYEFIDSTSTSLTFKFGVKNIWKNNQLISSWQSKYFQLKITGLQNKDTSIKSSISQSGFDVSNTSLSSISPWEIKNSISSESSSAAWKTLESILYNNITNIFDNIPTLSGRNLWIGPAYSGDNNQTPYGSIEVISSTTIRVNFTIDKIVSNGKLLNSMNDVTRQNFSVVVKGLANKDTNIKANVQTSGLNAKDIGISSPSIDITNDLIKDKINSSSVYINKLYDNLPIDAEVKKVNILSKTQSTLTFSITLNKIYKNGVLTSDEVDCTWNDILLTNITQNITSLKVNTISANGTLSQKNPYDVSEEDIKIFTANNINNLFNNAPTFTAQEVTSVKIQIDTWSSISVTISIPAYVEESINVQRNTFTYKIINLLHASNGVTHSENIDNIKDYFPNVTTPDTLEDKVIIDFVNENWDLLIENLPKDAEIVIDSIQRNDLGTEIQIKYHVNKYYDNNGNIINKNLNLSSKLKGFNSQIDNANSSDNSNSSIDWWIWLIIGLSILLLIILIIIIFIIFKKKKEKENKNKNFATVVKAPNSNNKLMGPTSQNIQKTLTMNHQQYQVPSKIPPRPINIQQNRANPMMYQPAKQGIPRNVNPNQINSRPIMHSNKMNTTIPKQNINKYPINKNPQILNPKTPK